MLAQQVTQESKEEMESLGVLDQLDLVVQLEDKDPQEVEVGMVLPEMYLIESEFVVYIKFDVKYKRGLRLW